MKNIIVIASLLFYCKISAQSSYDFADRRGSYISRNNVYEIQYDKTNWKIDTAKTEWDVDFDDKFKLIRINFIELSSFIGEKKMKASLKDQFGKLGKVKHINGLDVDYFELDLMYYGNIWKYQGFYYSGRSGTVQLDVRVQEEGIKMLQPQIDEFYKGFREIK